MMNVSEVREQIEKDLVGERYQEAYAGLVELWRAQPTTATAVYTLARAERLRGRLPLTPCRLAILRSFTVEPLVPLARAMALAGGIDLTVQTGDFNAYAQEILDPGSRLHQFAPDAVLLAVQTRDIAPELWDGFPSLSEERRQAAAERVIAELEGLLARLRESSAAHIIVHGLELPPHAGLGILESRASAGQRESIREINRRLREFAATRRGVHLLDYDEVIAGYGRERWYDERRWLTMRLPMVADAMPRLAEEWVRYLHPIAGRICKALVVDLDNTLWGGVIGEDGMEGIQLDAGYPGAAFQALQRAILDLRDRGVLVAISSKNNAADALAAIERHPGMRLRPEHFAAMRIDWNDKAANLRAIASELNIGVDAIAFLDDNPAERALIRRELPEATVIELPADPMGFAAALRRSPVFERLTISAEDRERGRYYAEQRQRSDLQHSTASLDDYYRSLAQRVAVRPADAQTVPRIAQLTQKTNQFNLTTRRYTEQQIEALAGAPDSRVYSARVEDRFGDHGLVGVAIVRAHDAVWEIDAFLLSCRVIGRTVETALLAFLAAEARAAGAARLAGWFLPTKKNAPAEAFYPSHQFQLARKSDEGTWWTLDLATAEIACPEWIELAPGAPSASSALPDAPRIH
ncbi:MAG: HAD-IIIC family phosphatase [Blastocatellia bacterium]|nr:HAD-IIIC family phosphatase [Blastocatellia bacterium]